MLLNLLLKLKGHELASIGKYLASAKLPEETRQELQSTKYKGVQKLLNDAIKYIDDSE